MKWKKKRTDSTSGKRWDESDQAFAKSEQQRETESKNWAGNYEQLQHTHWPQHRSKVRENLLVCWCPLLDRHNKCFEKERGQGSSDAIVQAKTWQ